MPTNPPPKVQPATPSMEQRVGTLEKGFATVDQRLSVVEANMVTKAELKAFETKIVAEIKEIKQAITGKLR